MRTHLRKTPHFFSYYKCNASEKWEVFLSSCIIYWLNISSWVIVCSLNHLFTSCYWSRMGFPGGSVVKGSTYQCRRHQFSPWVGKIPWRREWQPTPVFLPGKFNGQRSLPGYRPWDCKELGHKWATELNWTDLKELMRGFPRGSVVKNLPVNAGDAGLTLGWEDPLEKEMYPLQYSCLGNSMDRGAWWATVCRVAKSQTQLTMPS